MTISFDRAEVRYPTSDGSVVALRETTLEISEPSVALIGANGSGKSTLARLVNGLVEPSSGRVTVFGLDTRKDGAEVRRRVGFVFTDPAAQLVMPTVVEDLALSLRRTHRDKGARRAAALSVLDRFGLGDLADRSVHSLSGGQRQLVALAGVLATDPDVLVADEPTTLLDLGNRAPGRRHVAGPPQQLVLVTHDLELAQRCARVVLVDDGAVLADGDPAEVVARYRAMA